MVDPVVDSSFLIAALVDEEHSAYAARMLAEMAGEDLQAPALIVWEVANVLDKKVRQGRLSHEDRLVMLGRFDELPILLHSAPDAEELRRLAELCDVHRLTAYDGAYLSLATREAAALATLDRRLAQAARAEGLIVHSPF